MAGARKGKGIFKGYAEEPSPAEAFAADFRWLLVEVARLPEARDEKGEKLLDPLARAERIRRTTKALESLISLGDRLVVMLEGLIDDLESPELELHPAGVKALTAQAILALTSGDTAMVRAAIAALTKATIEKPLPAPPSRKVASPAALSRNGKTIERPAMPVLVKR